MLTQGSHVDAIVYVILDISDTPKEGDSIPRTLFRRLEGPLERGGDKETDANEDSKSSERGSTCCVM